MRIDSNTVSGDYSFAFGRSVSVSSDYIAAFFSSSYKGKLGINEPDPTSTLHYDGSEASAITDSDMSLDDNDHTLFVDGGAAVTLPDADDCPGRIYYIRNTDTSNSSTITPDDCDIERSGSYTLPANEGIIIQNDGTNWWIIAEYD